MRARMSLRDIIETMSKRDQIEYRRGTRDPYPDEIQAVDKAIEFERNSPPDHPLLKQETTRSECWQRPYRGESRP